LSLAVTSEVSALELSESRLREMSAESVGLEEMTGMHSAAEEMLAER
jgi:hypothetical protein